MHLVQAYLLGVNVHLSCHNKLDQVNAFGRGGTSWLSSTNKTVCCISVISSLVTALLSKFKWLHQVEPVVAFPMKSQVDDVKYCICYIVPK